MDWRAINFDWNRAKAFLVTAEEGSLSAAAKALGLTQPTLGRQVTALEKELNVILFERVGQRLEPTPNAIELLENVRAMGQAATKVSLTASGQSEDIEGSICISVSEVYAVFIMPKIIAKIRQLEPKIKIELIATNEASDLRRREADIAIRNFQPQHADLIAKKIKDVAACLYATPDYIKSLQSNINNPLNDNDLKHAEFISFDNTGMLLNGLNERGLNVAKENITILTEHYIAHWELVKQGLGIGIMPEEIGDAEPLVTRVESAMKAIEFPIWLTTHRDLKTSRRVRFVYDLLAKELV